MATFDANDRLCSPFWEFVGVWKSVRGLSLQEGALLAMLLLWVRSSCRLVGLVAELGTSLNICKIQDGGVTNMTELRFQVNLQKAKILISFWTPTIIHLCDFILTLSWCSMRISTTMFWNLISMMAATVSSCGRSRVGPKTTPRLATVIRLCWSWLATLLEMGMMREPAFLKCYVNIGSNKRPC